MKTEKVPFYRWLILLAIALHLCAAWFSLGYYNPDEHHQILSYAAFKAGADFPGDPGGGLAADLARNYTLQYRSGLQPSIAYAVAKAMLAVGVDSPFIVAFILRLFSVALALAASLAFFAAFREELHNENVRRWTFAAILLCWVLIFYHARFSSEGWMASFILLGFGLWRMQKSAAYFAAGFCFGLAFACRYQAGFMLLPLALFFLWREKTRTAFVMAAGGVAALALEFAANVWFYGEALFPPLNYLNLHLHYTREGTEIAVPTQWTYYWRKSGEFVPPLGYFLPLFAAAFWVLFPRHPLTWATALYVLFHFYVDNRQTRFMLPILSFIPVMTAMVYEKKLQNHAVFNRMFCWLLFLTAAINAPLAAYAALSPATPEIKILRDCVLPNVEPGETVFFSAGRKKGDPTLSFHYYTRDEINFTLVNNESELAQKIGDMPALYVSRKLRDVQLRDAGFSFRQLCIALPEWVLRYNIGGWADRASLYPVYEITKK